MKAYTKNQVEQLILKSVKSQYEVDEILELKWNRYNKNEFLTISPKKSNHQTGNIVKFSPDSDSIQKSVTFFIIDYIHNNFAYGAYGGILLSECFALTDEEKKVIYPLISNPLRNNDV